jgi:hypothetical protein
MKKRIYRAAVSQRLRNTALRNMSLCALCSRKNCKISRRINKNQIQCLSNNRDYVKVNMGDCFYDKNNPGDGQDWPEHVSKCMNTVLLYIM